MLITAILTTLVGHAILPSQTPSQIANAQSQERVLLAKLGTADELSAALALPTKYRDDILPILRKNRESADPATRLKTAIKLADLGNGEGFGDLLDAFEREKDPSLRGGIMILREAAPLGHSIFSLLGRPDTFDTVGSDELTKTVIDRWRKRWKSEGIAMLDGLKKKPVIAGLQEASLADLHLRQTMPDMARFFYLAGPKCYEVGTMDGGFPPIGRMLGDQGGIWAHPFKLLDGFSFTVKEAGKPDWALLDCQHFSHDFASGTFEFNRNETTVTRRDFATEGDPALLSRLSLKNWTNRQRTITLQFNAAINIRSTWLSGMPNGLDRIDLESGRIYATDPLLPEARALIGADRQPNEQSVADNIATLSYTVTLPPHASKSITFVVQAHPSVQQDVRSRDFDRLASSFDALLAEKQRAYRQAALGGVRFQSDDRELEDAFLMAKANVKMLTCDLRPYFPARYVFAGIPVYMQLFGNDTEYSVTGETAAGFSDIGRESLLCLAEQQLRYSRGIPHEVTTNARVVGSSNVQETVQFVGACWRYFNWTGDREFLKKIYPVCLGSVEYELKRFDPDHHGYPEGHGLMETDGMGPAKLDGASYLFDAYQSIVGMATAIGDKSRAVEFTKRTEAFRKRFNHDWWVPKANIWADSLDADKKPHTDGYWSVMIPQEVGLADKAKADQVIKQIERGWVNQWGAVGQRRADVGSEEGWAMNGGVFCRGAFNYGFDDFGFRMLKQATLFPKQDGMLGAFPEFIPPRDGCFIQAFSSAQFLQDVMEGLCGIYPEAWRNRAKVVLRNLSQPNHWSVTGVQIGRHQISMTRNGNQTAIRQDAGSSPLEISIQIPKAKQAVVSFRGHSFTLPAATHSYDTNLKSGESVTISLTKLK